jgi:large subunit ribosomal protein L17
MRHGRRGRKLNRTASHKKAMLNNMATSLFEHGALNTTFAKAKELRGMAERLISFAKRGDLHARRQVLRRIRNQIVVSKLFDEIGPGYESREGGYIRLLKLGHRRGDSVEMCRIELVGEELRSEYSEKSSSRDESARSSTPKEKVEESAEETSEPDEEEAQVTQAEKSTEESEESEGNSDDSGDDEESGGEEEPEKEKA